ncbi:MAG: hypothetical protein H8K07_20385 [Nitrospira sp.]|nr:hypothetical protein [Nitrospira sp.]
MKNQQRIVRSCMAFFHKLRWIDGTPLAIEPYRERLFTRFFDERREDGALRYNLGLFGRGKKNWKSADLCFGALWSLMEPTPGQHEVLLVAFDEDQASNDLQLIKLIIRANPPLEKLLTVRDNMIARNDGLGFIKVLPGQSAAGEHGRTYRFLGIDEIHNQKTWDLLEALQPDPTRANSQVWITSYASLLHKPGVPLFDLTAMGKAGTDPRMLFSWFAADYCTDPEFAELEPELRANPSIGSWPDGRAYLDQQKRRLPAHKFRRLHLNLPGLPSGSAFQVEPVISAIVRGVTIRPPIDSLSYSAFVDMSGGSLDDAVLCMSHLDEFGHAVVDRLVHQGQVPPFDPMKAVTRFAAILKEYGCFTVIGDRFGGETFRAAFAKEGITYQPTRLTKHQLYEAFEPHLNARKVVLLDVPEAEQQLLGLVWRGGRIDHLPGEHDDWANAVVGGVEILLNLRYVPLDMLDTTDPRTAVEIEEAHAYAEQQRYEEGVQWLQEQVTRMDGCYFPGD